MVELLLKSKSEAELFVRGEVGADVPLIPPGLEKLTVRIDSLGGDALGGLRLYTAIKESDAKQKNAVVVMAMSAASLPMAACDVIQMTTGSLVMIHGVSDYTQINRGNAEQIIKELNSLDDTYASCYSKASKTPASVFKNLMLNDTFLNCFELQTMGFNVEIIENTETHLPSAQLKTKTSLAARSGDEKALVFELMNRLGF